MITIAEQRAALGLTANQIMAATCTFVPATWKPGHEIAHHYQASARPGVLWECTECGKRLYMGA